MVNVESRVTIYTTKYISDLQDRFFEKFFNQDPRSINVKLKFLGIPKGTFSYFRKRECLPKKKYIEIMRAYLEDRDPVFRNLAAGKKWCCGCENIVDSSQMKDRWHCLDCKNEMNRKSKVRTGYLKIVWARRKYLLVNDLNFRNEFLSKRRDYYLRRNYGLFWKNIKLVRMIERELRSGK